MKRVPDGGGGGGNCCCGCNIKVVELKMVLVAPVAVVADETTRACLVLVF